MSLRIKICGVTNLDDARAAADAGADAIGFMFYESSSRNVSLAVAAAIASNLPPFVCVVGVFIDPTESFVRRAAVECNLGALQFHGEEPPEFCARFSDTKIIKAIRVKDAESLRILPNYATSAWLLDSFVAGQLGGTGEKFNWDLALEAKSFGKPIILAGGLTAANVGDAVRRVRPYAVDVSSGVETAPGKKDRRKIAEFIAAARC
ncbi:MAG: phosphoribosylanthranilate isomerase [Verrucomicrobia bacterium]|nr:phosphoribosylanthranilate isomerase [Verrucomicrobiota bacterium]